MKYRVAIFLFLLVTSLCLPLCAYSHDIGVSSTTLSELPGNQYKIDILESSSKAFLFPTPTLPSHCRFTGNPSGIVTESWKRFEFTCDSPLTSEHSIQLPWERDGIMLKIVWIDGSSEQHLIKNKAGSIIVHLDEFKAGSGSFYRTFKRYIVLGIDHILDGIDHLLFVLGLLLLVNGKWKLVKTITAFTIAHSITLGLATFGIIDIPQSPVEAVIALSIVLLAVEIIHAKQGRRGLSYHFPWLIAFGFGLVHGLGFAGALAEIGLPQSEIPIALLLFNIGVEIGQLFFVLVFLILHQLFCQLPLKWPTWSQLIPAYSIGIIACYWLIERVAFIVLPT